MDGTMLEAEPMNRDHGSIQFTLSRESVQQFGEEDTREPRDNFATFSCCIGCNTDGGSWCGCPA